MENAKESVEAAAETVKASVAKVADKVGSKFGNNSLVVLTLFGVIVGAFVLAVILYYIIMQFISSSKTYILPETRIPLMGTQLKVCSGTNIPVASNGKRMTITFWIYINDMNVNAGSVRRIFNRGGKDSIDQSSPFVALDGSQNKIHVIFTTKDPVSQYIMTGADGQVTNFATQAASASTQDKVNFLSTVHGIQIEYVPMQRWVHVAVVVNEEASGGIISSYIDGELVNTVGSSKDIVVTMGTNSVPKGRLNMANFDLNTGGSVNVGSDNTSAIPGFSGLVAGVGFTNSDLNANDIYSMYLQGPVNSYLAKVGLSGYGVQSPIYRVA